jgi:hypothetical protein
MASLTEKENDDQQAYYRDAIERDWGSPVEPCERPQPLLRI